MQELPHSGPRSIPSKHRGLCFKHPLTYSCSPRLVATPTLLPQSNPQAEFPKAQPQALDLLTKLLSMDPAKRIQADTALNHSWFAEVREPDLEARAKFSLDLSDTRDPEDLAKSDLQSMVSNEILQFHHSQLCAKGCFWQPEEFRPPWVRDATMRLLLVLRRLLGAHMAIGVLKFVPAGWVEG